MSEVAASRVYPGSPPSLTHALHLLTLQKGSLAPAERQVCYTSKWVPFLYACCFRLGFFGAACLYILSTAVRNKATIHAVDDVPVEDHSNHVHDALFAADCVAGAGPRLIRVSRSRISAWADIPLLRAIMRDAPPRSFTDMQLLVHTLRFYRVFEEFLLRPGVTRGVIVCNDLTPRSVGLLAAAKAHGFRTGLFLVPSGNVTYLLDRDQLFDVVFCTEPKHIDDFCALRICDARSSQPIRLEALRGEEKLVPGLLLSSYYALNSADLQKRAEEMADLCSRLAEFYRVDHIRVRAHPADRRIVDMLRNAPCVALESTDEPFSTFARRVNLAFAGNTSGILRLLSHGVPVVYLDGLDEYGHDFFGYARDSIVMAASAGLPSPSQIAAFYESRVAAQRTPAAGRILSKAAALAFLRGSQP